MGRRLTLFAEVVRGWHNALAEVILPDAIDHHARRERICGIGDPLSQLQAAAAFDFFRQQLSAEYKWETPRHYLAEPIRVPLDLHLDVADLADALLRLILSIDNGIG